MKFSALHSSRPSYEAQPNAEDLAKKISFKVEADVMVHIDESKSCERRSITTVTSRWFGAAYAGTVIISQKPANAFLDRYFSPEIVVEIDPYQELRSLWRELDKIYTNRDVLLQKAKDYGDLNKEQWTLKNRIVRILNLINTTIPQNVGKVYG